MKWAARIAEGILVATPMQQHFITFYSPGTFVECSKFPTLPR